MQILYLEGFGKAFVPKKFVPHLRSFVFKAGYDEVPYKFFGFLFYLTLCVTYAVYFIWVYPYLKGSNSLLLMLGTFSFWVVCQLGLAFFVILVVYFFLDIKIYKRRRELESRLQEYLALVSTNLKGGMSFDKALWAAIKPQFGILAKEITLVSKKVLTGNDVGEALEEFADKYNSPILKRSIDLLVSEIESGGKITKVIDSAVEDLKKANMMKEELAASTLSFTIFIMAIVVFIAPGLFALSLQLLKIVTSLSSTVGGSLGGGGGGFSSPISMSFGGPKVEDFRRFSLIAISIITTFSSMIISIVEKGDVRGGIKYIPIFLISALVLYFVFTFALDHVFAGIMTI
ncbi:MAG TPA: type II secretion system F family protein [Candidatus Nanoarchaeia archaeon]|nr:type II secretion system F family protein [Candidatus Nanoarchaeia archaeon]